VAPAERGSEHPLAEAIVAGARERGIEPEDAAQFEAIAGHGIRAEIDGHTVLVGNRRLMADSGVDVRALEEEAAVLAGAAKPRCSWPWMVGRQG
jgi:cation transport ATPase